MVQRHHKRLPMHVCLSPIQASSATGLHYERHIKPAVESGVLPVYLIGDGARPKRRILVSDLEAWLRAHPQLITQIVR